MTNGVANIEQVVVKRPDSAVVREAIFRLENWIKEQPGSGLEESGITWVHRFTPGMYTREMIVPAGCMLTGAIHKTEHISIMLTGRMLIPHPVTGKTIEISAPIVEVAQPGIKRVGVALEEVRWLTMHPTELTDVDEIIELITTNDFAEVAHLVDQSDRLIESEGEGT